MNWINLTASTEKAGLDVLETWFWDNGAVSVTVEDAEDAPIFEPPPGEQPVWDQILVTGLFESDVVVDDLLSALEHAQFKLSKVEELADRHWEREWLSRFKPMQFGRRLWVCPTAFEIENEGKVVIQLDPGLAFGTGTHETTRLCLEYLDAQDLTGKRVLDYGCGSGILALGAALLGAERVVCIDNDSQALTATRENAKLNNVTLETYMNNVVPEPADVVLANILAQPLVELSDMLCDCVLPGGLIILSGIMSSQGDWVQSAYTHQLTLIDRTELNGWVRIVLGR